MSRYADRPIDPEVVDRALLAAHHAPCHKLTWPWRFTRTGPETRSALFDIAISQGSLDDERRKKLEVKFQNPAQLVVVTQVLAADPLRREEDYAATCCAIQNAMLSLAADGVGSKWSTGKLTRSPKTHALLGLDTEIERMVGFLWMGVPACEHKAPPRPPLADVLRTLP